MTNHLVKFRNLGFAIASVVFASGVAYAATPGGGPSPTPVKQISFAEFKDRCANPEKYPDIQVAPQHTVFQCESDELDWVPEQPGTLPLPSSRVVQGAVISDKFAVAADSQDIDIPTKGGSCLRFKQVQRTIKLEVPLGCNDIQKYDSAVEYCQTATDAAGGANPKLVTTKDSGLVLDTCAGAAPHQVN